MEVLGAAASVIAVIQISAEVFDICRKYYIEVKVPGKTYRSFGMK